ncbi:MAG: hypothetical protein ACOCUI_04290 [bacterium]
MPKINNIEIDNLTYNSLVEYAWVYDLTIKQVVNRILVTKMKQFDNFNLYINK